MKSSLRIGLWEHWMTPDYDLGKFLNENGVNVSTVQFKKKGYLEDLDVLIINQYAVNDYLENDRNYLHDFVRRGGICWILHQDHFRCNPCFLPVEAGRPLLVSRYYRTLGSMPPSTSYLMPWPEEAGKALFNVPNRITMDEIVYWELEANSITAVGKQPAEKVTTCALSAITDTEGWEILGSYVDPAMPDDSALIMQKKYGKGLFFWSQILFPETKNDPSGKVFPFWKRFSENTLEHFRRFHQKEAAPAVPALKKAIEDTTPGWRRTVTHLHTLDWYAADNHLGGLNAALRALKMDVAVIAFKDGLSYHNHLDCMKFCDEKVTILPGMEYHPFNFNSKGTTNTYHILAFGNDTCDDKFTRTLFDDGDAEAYVREALAYNKAHGFVSCATHPWENYWRKYDYDAVDTYNFELTRFEKKPFTYVPFCGTEQEKAWLEGSHITLMLSVDMWGVERLRRNPLCNFIWYDGAPTIENMKKAVKAGHVIPGFGVDKADIRMGGLLPGDTVTDEALAKGIRVKVSAPERLTAVELYADDKLVSTYVPEGDGKEADTLVPTAGIAFKHFLRIEVVGEHAHLVANPFFVKA